MFAYVFIAHGYLIVMFMVTFAFVLMLALTSDRTLVILAGALAGNASPDRLATNIEAPCED